MVRDGLVSFYWFNVRRSRVLDYHASLVPYGRVTYDIFHQFFNLRIIFFVKMHFVISTLQNYMIFETTTTNLLDKQVRLL